MKTKNRILAFLAAVFMLAAASGCGKGDKKPTSSTANSQDKTNTSQGGDSSQEEEDPPLEVVDLNGKNIRIMAWWNDLPPAEATSESQIKLKQRLEKVQKDYNCTFEAVVVPVDNLANQFAASCMSGDVLAEIIYMRWQAALGFMGQEENGQSLLYPVSDIYDLDRSIFNETITDMFKGADGKSYAFSAYGNAFESALVFNKTLLDKLGIEDPYTLVKNNQWTMEKFRELCQQVVQRSGGEAAGTGHFGSNAVLNNQLFNGFGAKGVYKDASGKYVSGLKEQNTYDAIEYLRKLEFEDKVTVPIPEGGATWDYSIKQFYAGKVGFLSSSLSSLENYRNNMEDKFGVIPAPYDPKYRDAYFNVPSDHNVRLMHGSLDPEEARKIALAYTAYLTPEKVSKEESERLNREKYEGICWDKESVDNIMMMFDLTPDPFNETSYVTSSVFWDPVDTSLKAAVYGDKTVSAAIDEVAEVWETAVSNANSKKDE